MSRVAGIINKVNNALLRTVPTDRGVYKRFVSQVGGDSLIGRPGSISYSDTFLTPQPLCTRLGRERIPGGHALSETLVDSKGMFLADDYQVVTSPTAITAVELSDPTLQIVLKGASSGGGFGSDPFGASSFGALSSNVELLTIRDFESIAFQGADCVFILYCRSVSRP